MEEKIKVCKEKGISPLLLASFALLIVKLSGKADIPWIVVLFPFFIYLGLLAGIVALVWWSMTL